MGEKCKHQKNKKTKRVGNSNQIRLDYNLILNDQVKMPPKKQEAKAIEKLNQKLNQAFKGSKAPAKSRVQDDFNVVPLKRNEKLELEQEDDANKLLNSRIESRVPDEAGSKIQKRQTCSVSGISKSSSSSMRRKLYHCGEPGC